MVTSYPPLPFLPAKRPYSDATAEKMDLEARQMVDDAYNRTLDLVRENKEQVCVL